MPADERPLGAASVQHEMPTAAVFAHWRSAWFDMSWRESVDHAWAKQPEKMAGLLASVQAVGITEPIALGTDGRVWDGHHRLAVACRLGLSSVPVRFAALVSSGGCPTCGLPETVHALWCPVRPGPPDTADDVLRRVHAVFADPSRAWFAEQFWTAFAAGGAS